MTNNEKEYAWLNFSIWKLPKEMRPNKESFESVGFIFEDIGDKFYYQATLPNGWKIKPDIGFLANLLDEKDRIRGHIFIQKNGSNHNCFMGLIRRFHIKIEDYNDTELTKAMVKEFNGKIIYTTILNQRSDCSKKENLQNKCLDYLNSHFPGWEDVTKYWD